MSMGQGPTSGAYRIYGYGHSLQLGSSFTVPGDPPSNNLWPVIGYPQDTYGLAYFHLVKLANGKYHINLASAPVISSNSALYANASASKPEIEWTIEGVPQHGKTAHLISGPTNNPVGVQEEGWWTSAGSSNENIYIEGPLISTPSVPPYFPGSKVFHIDELD